LQAVEERPTVKLDSHEPLSVTWFTDPHNIWCWGCEPTMRRLEILYPDAVRLDVRQGGLFENFGPVREQWARMSGGRWLTSIQAFFDAVASQHRMPMDTRAMIESVEDFESTWPACIAAKAAELQGRDEGWRYLRSLREAWTLDGRGIHRRSVQVEVARETGLDVSAFEGSLDDGRAAAAFRTDREECARQEVTGFPAFAVSRGDTSIRINGWQPWEVFEDVLRQVEPGLVPRSIDPTEASVVDVLRRYDRCATREIAAVLGAPDDDAEILLEELEGRGDVMRRPIGSGILWELAPSKRHRAVGRTP